MAIRLVTFVSVVIVAFAMMPDVAYSADRYALLVGCTRYPGLPLSMQLRGPENDVSLMAKLLTDRFRVPADNIVALTESAGSDRLPTRSNIVREVTRLTDRVRDGDQVIVLLAGHGSQQPDDTQDAVDDHEPDGLDELFLPRDIGGWDGTAGSVTNAITDDELRKWFGKITAKGVSMWVVIDACHSGTMIREVSDEQSRQVPPSLLVPAEAIEGAKKRTGVREGKSTPHFRESFGVAKAGGIVAFYAAQSHEPTVEKPLPPDANTRTRYGLLTYTLNQVLMQASSPLTYRELAQRIHQQYDRWGRTSPTPLIEGTDCDAEVLGSKTWNRRSQILLTTDAAGRSVINAGAIHGITVGSVLAIFPSAGSQEEGSPIAYVRVESVSPLASVVMSCGFRDLAVAERLPQDGRCEVIQKDYGAMRLRCFIEPCGIPETHPSAQKARVTLEQLAKKPQSLVERVDKADDADCCIYVDANSAWLVTAVTAGREVTAKPIAGGGRAAWLGPASMDGQWAPWLEERLERIARVRNLMVLVNTDESASDGTPLAVDMQMLRTNDVKANPQEVVNWASGRNVRAGEVVAFRIRNAGKDPVDVTLLFIDSTCGISPFFPTPGFALDSRILPGQEVTSPRAQVTQSDGLEHMLMIAVRASPERLPIDFSSLCQRSSEKATATRGTQNGTDSPLGLLLQTAVFASGGTRSIACGVAEPYAIRAMSWDVSEE